MVVVGARLTCRELRSMHSVLACARETARRALRVTAVARWLLVLAKDSNTGQELTDEWVGEIRNRRRNTTGRGRDRSLEVVWRMRLDSRCLGPGSLCGSQG